MLLALVLAEGVRGLNATAATLRRGELKGEGDVGRLLLLCVCAGVVKPVPLLLAALAVVPVLGRPGGGTAERGEEGALSQLLDPAVDEEAGVVEGLPRRLNPPQGLLELPAMLAVESKLSLCVEEMERGAGARFQKRGEPRGLPEPMTPGSGPVGAGLLLRGGAGTPPR